MQLTDSDLNDYIKRILFFGHEEKQKYEGQVAFLKQKLTNAIHENTNLGVIKINQAGSWRKGTALRPLSGQDIDIDLIVYLQLDEKSRGDINKLHEMIVALLRKAYPSKPPSDFTANKKTVGIEFRTSGLLVDLVPVIPVTQPTGYVWQPEQGGGGTFLTSPDGQLDFVRKGKEADPRFTQVVRLAKRWRNYAEVELSSFAIELLAAHLNAQRGPSPTIEDGFLRFLLYLVQSELRQVIRFAGAIRNTPATDLSPVRIYDPTNNENNATARMAEADRLEITKAAYDALQAVNHAKSVARKGETEGLWQRVVGPQFSLPS